MSRPSPPPGENRFAEALRAGLRERGWERVDIEIRYAAGQVERLPDLAAELVALPVDVIVVGGTPVIKAAKEATQTISIVIAVAADPVGTGLVTPGGNVTGQDVMSPELATRQPEALLARVDAVFDRASGSAVPAAADSSPK